MNQTSAAPRIAPDWLRAVVDPRRVQAWSLADWDTALRHLRKHRLLARLDGAITRKNLQGAVPPQASRHLLAARQLSQTRTLAMTWAITQLPAMLEPHRHPLVLLKGAAYIGQQLAIANGRLPSDLDILVPKAQLAEVRLRLAMAGWREPPLDEHDRRYYLEWSHELPPMQHGRHAIELDVHHNILPPRAGRMVDAALLFADLRSSQWPDWQVLSPVDQVLHSAAHLFFDSEPRDRARDLVDLDGLFRHFGSEPGFWADLSTRAGSLGLLEPLALACHFTHDWLDTPIPGSVQAHLALNGPGRAKMAMLVALLGAVLRPGDVDRPDTIGKRLAATALLARYHWHRLPLRVLLPHLWRKWRAPAAAGDAAPP
jgi:Uncharacterised nucleotidyltransferase